MNWMISANGKMYDHAAAFQRWGFIDWRQRARYEVGDIVYIYCTRPYKRVMYKTIVEAKDMSVDKIVDDREYWYQIEEYNKAVAGKYARLKLVDQVDTDFLSLENLTQHGLNAAPQGPVKMTEELTQYVDLYMNDYDVPGVFPDSDLDDYSEGDKVKVTVNKYERSSIAREKCVEYNGIKCAICGFDFEEFYGPVGNGFIHIHHIKPIHEIGKKYQVDYKNDLIPVCPNCHAMLHRKLDGEYLTIDELKKAVEARRHR